MTTFEAEHDEMVMVRDIPLYSICEHHLTPFHGHAHVAYIPNEDGRITGLSKLARLVDGYAKRPQVQERLTTQIADALMERLQPRGAFVMIEAEHLCMSMRGVRKPGIADGHVGGARQLQGLPGDPFRGDGPAGIGCRPSLSERANRPSDVRSLTCARDPPVSPPRRCRAARSWAS